MKNAVKKSLSGYIKITEEELDFFYGLLELKTFKRRKNILSAGNVCKHAFFIVEGCIRYFNIVDGEEHTGQFFFEGSWYSDYESFLFERPSEQTIQTLEETTVALLAKSTLENLYVEVPKFERFGRIMAENAFMGIRRRTESLTQLSALERYNQLVEKRPKVIQRIPQHYIASYLGIRPQSLSRIRNNQRQ